MKKAVAALVALCLMMSNMTALADSSWKCPECRAENTENFCGDCGTKRPDWTCAGCNRKIVTKYCVYCGMPKVYSDGLYAMNAGDYDTAIACFLTTYYGDYQTRLAAAYSAKGKQFATANNWDQAIVYLEKSCTEYLQALGQSGEVVATLPKDLRGTMLTLVSCYLLSGDAALIKDDWETACERLDKGIEMMSRFSGESLSNLADTCDLLSRNKISNWDSFFRRYAQQYEKMGMYAEAVELYAHVSQGQIAMEAARQKQKLQDQYAKQFNIETMFTVRTSDGKYIGQYLMDVAYARDYGEHQTLSPSIRITNSDASQAAKIKLTAKYDGEYYSWKEVTIAPRDNWNPYLNTKNIPLGGAYCEWYINDVLVSRIKYDVLDNKSYFKSSIIDKLETAMELCLWDNANSTVLESNVAQGVLDPDNSDHIYVPRIQITNNNRSAVDVVVSLRMNGQDAVVWKSDTIAPAASSRYIYGTFSNPVEGENTCIWYINGIEVLRDSYAMIRIPKETEAPTAEPTAVPTIVPTPPSTFMPVASPAPSTNP